MNNARRERIEKLMNELEDAHAQLETLRDEEQEAQEALPENLQNLEPMEALSQACSDLEECISQLEDAKNA